MKHILLVEDDHDIAALLRLNLEDEGYAITHEPDGGKALQRLEKQPWDAVILDLMLPNVDGLEICRRIRQMTRYLPVIIISARSSETDRVTGLETGADDYLAKPFSVQELIARIKALFRRQQAMGQAQADGHIQAHGLTIDPLARSVLLHGQVVDLTPREFEILRLMSEGLLIDQVASALRISEKTVHNTMSLVRQKLEERSDFRLCRLVLEQGVVRL